MLDIKLLRENPELVKKGITAKKADPGLVDQFLKIDAEWRAATVQLESHRAEQKKLSQERKIEEAKQNREKIKQAEEELKTLEEKRSELWMRIPNIPSEDTPVGKDEGENKVLRKWGEPRKFDFPVKDYMAIGEAFDLIDTETAAKVSGARFGYLKGEAAMLEFALIQFGLSVLTNEKILKKIAAKVQKGYSAKPFVPVIPPVMIRPEVMQKMARLEPKEERYYIPTDDVYLVGSAEHTLGPLHIGETIPEEEFPIRYVGFSTAFRREAGSYGKDTKGILRVHQFDKLEIESFTTSENSRKEQDFIVAIQEYCMQQLELPYEVMQICTGDMGGPDIRQIDINTWLPSESKYRETHTSDFMGDYQSRRLNTKIRRKDATEFVHMNDATVFSQRPILAILENYQRKDGKVEIPKVLQKYVGKKIIG
ncbi:MAG: serine--tRNA ligase [Candidatus Liptonbacteria bacterium]|nr:serine--tRNA ligase [Candidatus Liptonbacteria bacterium]